jgi:hypothetical protein
MLTKGPVALVQTIVPAVLYLILPPRHGIALRRWGWPLVAGVAIFLTSGLWWFALVIARKSGVLDLWYSEVARTGTGRESGTPVLTYLGIVYFIFPWTIFLIAGLMATAGREKGGGVLALLLLVVPLLVMTFVRDRQDRYALPMIPAAAVVIAVGVREYLRDWQAGNQIGRRNAWMHWSALAFVAVFVPIAGATPLLKQENGQPWFSLRFAVMEACFGAALVLAGILLHRRRPGALVAMTLVTMLVMQAVIFKGYCTSDSGRSGMKGLADVIGARYPDASFYNAHPRGKRPPTDLGVYLNRTIFWTGDPSQLRSSDHPIVLFMLQNNGEPEPQPPPGWHVVDKARRDKDWWWAFVLPPS